MTGKLCCRNERAEEQSLFRRCPSLLSLTLMSVLLSPLSLQAADIRRSGEDTFIIQQQRQEALEQQLTPSAPDVRLSAPGSFAHKINFPVETPCFQIKQTELKGADALPHWLPLQKIANGAVGHCLGAKGINLLMSTLQNRLVDHGYVTTRVLAPSQDLKSGILRLVVIPGVVRHVRLTPDSDDYIQLYSSFPAHEGSLLDLRDIEQGLENMQRLPGVQADMEIVPGEQPGESDILITRKQDKYWRLGFSLDDSGTRSTGRYLGGITFSLDNPFSLSDLLYVSATHNFPHYGGKGSKNYTAHYSVPFGYWQFSVTASDYDYHQTVAGAVEDYQYSGESQKVALPEAMVKGYITRLENQPVQGETSSPVTLPAQALRSDAPDVQEHQTLPHSRLVYVVSETKAEPTPSLQKSPPTFLKPFVAGVCAALLAVSVAIPGWQFLTQPSPTEQQLRALLTPPPDVLSADQMTQLSRTPSLLNHASEWITLSGQQITRLTELPPAYNLRRSAQCAAAAATEGTFPR